MNPRFVIRHRMESDTAALAEIFRRSIRDVASRDYRKAQIEAWVRFAEDSTAWEQRMRTRQVWVAVDDDGPTG